MQRDRVPQHIMAEEVDILEPETASQDDEIISRIYEIGYHIIPTVKEEDLEKVVSEVRSIIEKNVGSFIAEGAPSLTRLSYAMKAHAGAGDRKVAYDRAYFGWIKFEAGVDTVLSLRDSLKTNPNFLRIIIWKTVREDTRAKMKAPTLREVKRGDTIKTSRTRAPEEQAPVSEVDLEKALEEITKE